MIGKLLRFIFLPKKSRQVLATRERAAPKAAAAGARSPARGAGAPSRKSSPGEREQLLADAMTVYRKQREVYEELDEETRQQIEADAAKAFGDMAKRKS